MEISLEALKSVRAEIKGRYQVQLTPKEFRKYAEC